MILDSGPTLEAYPLFPDVAGPAELEIAPRVIDLERHAASLTGTVRRRFMRLAARCDAALPVHVTRCAGDAIELVLAEPAPPLGFAPCTWPGRAPSHVVRWRRQ
jgi:hypothetical protein